MTRSQEDRAYYLDKAYVERGLETWKNAFEEEKVHCFGLEFVADKIVFNGFPMEAESTISFAELTCMMAERAKR